MTRAVKWKLRVGKTDFQPENGAETKLKDGKSVSQLREQLIRRLGEG
ncbi:hypothetical protein SAMN05428962_0541 [Paenibacillus sp. BC26]|nr:hypothetical protein SAMN05428962_0541 [Paenibacillus sp. BC26]